MSTPAHRGFSLVEILVVVSILAILAALAMPMVGLARRTAARKNTESLLAKVETGLRLFKADMSVYPFQDHPAAAAFPAADNRLGWALAHDLTVAERADLDQDLAIARSAYRPGGTHELGIADLDPHVTADQAMHAGMVNRLAAERAVLAILSGNTAVRGLRNKPTQAIVPAPASQGYATDYLSRDLAREEIRNGVLVDHQRRPLVYICPVVPAMRRLSPQGSGDTLRTDWYGMGGSGRASTAVLASDMRQTAPERLRHGYEVIGVGADGLVGSQRDDAANRDNIVLGTVRGELQ
jgi:prepilin-type N-terminal cleavage/methylation domain-containing protein